MLIQKIRTDYYILNIVVAVLVISMFNPYYNPSFTLGRIIAVVYVLWQCYKIKKAIHPKIERDLSIGIASFLSCILLEGVIYNDKINLMLALDIVEQCTPFLLLCFLKETGDVSKGLKYGLIIVAILGAILSIYEFTVLDVIRPNSLLKNPNNWSFFLIMVIPVFAYGVFVVRNENKGILICTFFLSIISLLLTRSRGAIIATCVACVFSGICVIYKTKKVEWKTILYIILVLAVILVGLWPNLIKFASRSYDVERLYAYQATFNMWLDHPIIGVGFGRWQDFYLNIYKLPLAKEKLIHAHNIYLHILAAGGIIGFTSFILFLFCSFKTFLKQNSFYWLVGVCGLMMFMIQETFDATFTIRYCARAFWLCLFVYQYNIFRKTDNNKNF